MTPYMNLYPIANFHRVLHWSLPCGRRGDNLKLLKQEDEMWRDVAREYTGPVSYYPSRHAVQTALARVRGCPHRLKR